MNCTPALLTALSRIASKSVSVLTAEQTAWLRREFAASRCTPVATTTVGEHYRLAVKDHCGITLLSIVLWRSGMGGSVDVLPPFVSVDYSETQDTPIVATPEAKRSSNGGRAEAARLLAELNAADDIPEAPVTAPRPPYRTIVEKPVRPGEDVRGRGARID